MTAATCDLDLTDQARDLLDQLSADVPGTLRAAGIRGCRHSGGKCPVALYLQANGIPTAYVFEDCAEVRGIDWARIAMPGPVVEFVERFDDGAYPDLVIGGELR